jgi:hypothetical protein
MNGRSARFFQKILWRWKREKKEEDDMKQEKGQKNGSGTPADCGCQPALPEYWGLGVFCILIGAGAIWIARDYPYGTPTAMGPGFVPTAIAAILVLLGLLIVLLRGRDVREPEKENSGTGAAAPASAARWLGTLRVIVFIIGGIIFFGAALRNIGLALSTFVLIALVSFARPDAKTLPVLVLAASITAAACVLFVGMLSLEIAVFPEL